MVKTLLRKIHARLNSFGAESVEPTDHLYDRKILNTVDRVITEHLTYFSDRRYSI
jgi:hypothetical protein